MLEMILLWLSSSIAAQTGHGIGTSCLLQRGFVSEVSSKRPLAANIDIETNLSITRNFLGALADNRMMLNDSHRLAWFHVPKCGTSFGTTLAHYANSSLPTEARILSPDEITKMKGALPPAAFFMQQYPLEKYFKGHALWEGKKWGSHNPIDEDAFEEYQGHFVGLFRETSSRMKSSWLHLGQGLSPKEYGARIRGLTTKMLAGQVDGATCSLKSTWELCEKQEHVVPDLALALARLDAFKFVGLTGEYDLSVCLFHAMFGGDCSPNEFINMRPATRNLSKNPFEHFSDPYDDKVYLKAQTIFWRNMRRFNVSRSSCFTEYCPRVPEVFQVDADTVSMIEKPTALEYTWPKRLVLSEFDE